MNFTTLISNSGIQFLKYNVEINPHTLGINSLRFHQWGRLERNKAILNLDYAHYDSENDVLINKRRLKEDGFIDKNGKWVNSEYYNLNNYEHLSLEENAFSVNDISIPLEKFLNNWIPLPYFLQINQDEFDFGPTNWVRLKIVKDEEKKNAYHFILAVDTNTQTGSSNKYSENPVFRVDDEFATFQLCKDEQLLLDFCNEEHRCGWVNAYLKKLFFGDEDYPLSNFPELKYLGQYIYFLHFLMAKNFLPIIQLINDKKADVLEVGLVLDIGNSNTCGLLFELGDWDPFSKVDKLIIQDISQPEHQYDEPFSMRLALNKANFGTIGFSGGRQFVWPSITRVGVEAERLIYKVSSDKNNSKDKYSHYSSPKRYLWDNKVSRVQWEFIEAENLISVDSVYLEGISEQFKSDGTFTVNTSFGVQSNFSRQSLMTFVFLEIFANAYAQVNHPTFRKSHGNKFKVRKITKVIITCPTGMLQQEQYILRKSAQEARLALKRFLNNTYLENTPYNESKPDIDIAVTPSLRDLKMKLSGLADKKDWIYDEATCSQLVFMYAELARKYLSNCEEYFNLYGKIRKDIEGCNNKTVTIGSIDIGAGTTDVMIAAYKYDNSGKCVVTPIPLFWESFYVAGDNLVQKLIKTIIIEGHVDNERFRGCTGVIQNKLIEIGEKRVEEKLNDFFGLDNNRFNSDSRKVRAEFTTQIALPMALKFLEMTRNKSDERWLKFEDFFQKLKPQNEVLEAFSTHFGFKFEELIWKFSIDKINEVIVLTFEPLLKKISTILYSFGCDFVLLSGKPTSLHKIEDLFLKFYPLPIDRLITLNNYRVGQWYPFAEQTGYFKDAKSLVAVGAMIGNLGSVEDKLGNFRLDMSEMIRRMLSPVKYIGVYDNQLKEIKKIFLSPEIRQESVVLAGFPAYLGSKQFNTSAYPSKPVFRLDFDDEKIKSRLKTQYGDDPAVLNSQLEKIRYNITANMPLTVVLSRDFREDRELLVIESVTNSKRDEVSTGYFSIQPMSLDSEKGYWLDTGEFVLDLHIKSI